MGLLLQVIYHIVFKYICLPIFLLMMIGRPRFLINWVHKLILFKEPFYKIGFFRLSMFISSMIVGWSYYRKSHLERDVARLLANGSTSHHFIDEKMREAHLFQRNTYMFFTFIILMIVVEKFCHSYTKLWKLQDEAKELKNKEIANEKSRVLKKTE